MKINFNPTIYMMPFNAFDGGGTGAGVGSAGGTAAAAANPYGAIAQAGIGSIQTIMGLIQAKKAEKALEKMKSPVYKANQSILGYYDEALSRYGVNPQDSALYKRQQKNIQRGTATGLSALQDRRGALAGISKLVQSQNDASLNAEVAAEQQRNQRFGQLGQAAGMKANEERSAFDINEMQPFERKYNLKAAKAGGGAQIMNAGLHNLYGGLQSTNQYDMIRRNYEGQSNI